MPVVIPTTKSDKGLINLFSLTGTTSASSTHGNSNRTKNPINPKELDRWCSNSSRDKYGAEYWEVTFNQFIYITNYTILINQGYVLPISWKVDGKNNENSKGWITISTIREANLVTNSYETYNVSNSGPFNVIRMTSLEMPLEVDNYYYFCLWKVDFFGASFSMPCVITLKEKKIFSLKFLFITFFLN